MTRTCTLLAYRLAITSLCGAQESNGEAAEGVSKGKPGAGKRLGMMLYRFSRGLAFLAALVGTWLFFVRGEDGTVAAGIALWGGAVLVWLLGRAARFILVRPGMGFRGTLMASDYFRPTRVTVSLAVVVTLVSGILIQDPTWSPYALYPKMPLLMFEVILIGFYGLGLVFLGVHFALAYVISCVIIDLGKRYRRG